MTDATIDEGDAVTVHNRPVTVKKPLPNSDRTVVHWEDIGREGTVETEAVSER